MNHFAKSQNLLSTRLFATAGLYTYIHYMKQIFRILIGLPLSPFVIILGTCVWICTDDEDWMEGVGTHAWYLASGQWNKLPE